MGEDGSNDVSHSYTRCAYTWRLLGYRAVLKTMSFEHVWRQRSEQISTRRYMFTISEESAGRCNMCTSCQISTAMNRDQCHCIYAVVCMLTCLKATNYDLDSNPRRIKLPDKAWFT